MDFDQVISTSIEQQFPDFYRSEGTNFVAFVRAYYEWMEQEGYVLNASRNLLSYKDIDTTVDQFVDRFKNEFLVNFPAENTVNKGLLVKRIKDFYSAKGSDQATKLLFRLLFQDDVDIYDPGGDIIKASDGVWKTPFYLEVDADPKVNAFIGQKITGSKSKAVAFVDSVYTKNIKGQFINVLYISNIKGLFRYNESITINNDKTTAIKIRGSLSSISITNGGNNNRIGDIFTITSSDSGQGGSARVVATVNGSGLISFQLDSGGQGYTNSYNQLILSDFKLNIDNAQSVKLSNSYAMFDTIYQPLINVYYTASVPSNPNNALLLYNPIYGYNGSTRVANGTIVYSDSTSNSLVINLTGGSFSTVDNIKAVDNAFSFPVFTTSDSTTSAEVVKSGNASISVRSSTKIFYSNAIITSNTTDFTNISLVKSKSTGFGANVAIGAISPVDTLYLNSDIISNASWYSSNISTFSGYSNAIINSLTYNEYTLGSIDSLGSINPGSNYNDSISIVTRDPLVAGFNRKNIVLDLRSVSGNFLVDDSVNCVSNVITQVITYNSKVGLFNVGEGLTQSNGSVNAYAVISYSNSTNLILNNIRGTFRSNTSGGQSLYGLTNGATANVTVAAATDNTTTQEVSLGRIISLTDTFIELERVHFNSYDGSVGSTVTSSSGGSAIVRNWYENYNSAPYGFNAQLNDTVGVGTGIATELEILDSGFGYDMDSAITLTNLSNTSSYAITGTAILKNQGIGLGYWDDNRGKLNSDKFVTDSYYYQDFSYEVQTRLSLNKYADIIKSLAHIVGTKLFGSVIIRSNVDKIYDSHTEIDTITGARSMNFSIANNSTYIPLIPQ